MSTMEKKSMSKKKKKVRGPELQDFVFSWSIKDVLNKDLYREKVKHIPETFNSTVDYLESFKYPLIEETRADFCSALECVHEAPVCEITSLVPSKDFKHSKAFYQIIIKCHGDIPYSPAPEDVILLTNSRVSNVEDLNSPAVECLIACVVKCGHSRDYKILSSNNNISSDLLKPCKSKRVFATYMINLTTNTRIWLGLNWHPHSSDFSLIRSVLHYDSSEVNGCCFCYSAAKTKQSNLISSFGLDKSQESAILTSISMRNCSHNTDSSSKVNLIWGPPGTGKTKTVASLLFALLELKCSTLTCAPTNTAVVQVVKRLMSLVLRSPDKYGCYRLGDIVLFGNEERMKIDDHDDLAKVFLEYRVPILGSAIRNWKCSLETMISLLGDPKKRYNEYKKAVNSKSSENGQQGTSNSGLQSQEGKNQHKKSKDGEYYNNWSVKQGIIIRKKKHQVKRKDSDDSQNSSKGAKLKPEVQLLTFEGFVQKTFYSLTETFMACAIDLYTHLPTSCIPLGVDEEMMNLVDRLKKLKSAKEEQGHYKKLMKKRIELLAYFERLYERYPGPKLKGKVSGLCKFNAYLIFCTASSSIKVNKHVEMVIIDEAAQLKECESVIPLRLGLKNAVLIGDDRQLPAMVKSKVSENANFGRSLFQRLTTSGKRRHLLNIQYRMHPSISIFPNREFYGNKIIDAPHVKETSYQRKILKGKIYGSYSFINVERGKESFDKGHSPRNVEEAAVIDQIIAKLFKGHCTTKQKISIGVISPYKGQVGLIQDKIGNKYAGSKGEFTVSVRSVDGFQGGEEDVILISTVRSNSNGSVGFLSNHQRTNVALTRARYCMWVVGNEATLINSGSIWTDLVLDAKTRGCFYNANDYKDLNKAKLEFSDYLLDFSNTRWKVVFTEDFKISIASINNNSKKIQKQVQEILRKIADGWRQSTSEEAETVSIHGVAAELLELYLVDKDLYLAWTVDIQKEESKDTQIIKVRDILPASKILKLARELDVLFGKYTVDFMNRCKCKSFEGSLVVPMSWPFRSVFSAEHLSDRLSDMHIRDDDQEKESSTSIRSMTGRLDGMSSTLRWRRR